VVPDASCHFCRFPNALEAAIVATLSDTRPKRRSAPTAATSSAGEDTELFSTFDAGAGSIICHNKVLRPIRRFCFRRSRPCYPNSFGTGSHRIQTISASAFAPEPERTENINIAAASTARAAWPSLQTRLLVRPPPPAPRLSSRHPRATGLDQSRRGSPAEGEPGHSADPRRARKRAPLEVVASN
jgi:hypothetical protein